MSSTPPATTEPTPPAAARPVETAPSATLVEGAALARLLGFIGLFLLVLGAVVVIATRATGTARWLSEGWGFVFAGFGLVLMLYHAISDGEQEVRRMYGGLAAGFLVLTVAAALIPGPFNATGDAKQQGYYLLPWGLGAGFLSLMFVVPFTRHETDPQLRSVALNALLGVGGLLCVGVVAWGLVRPDFLAGTGLALAVLGVGFLCAYLGQADTDDGVGFTAAFVLGAVGFAVLFYAFGRTVFPTVLFDGPAVLRKPNQALDYWKAAGRGLVIAAFLGLAALGALGRFSALLRAALVGAGLIGAGVFVAACFGTQLAVAPKPFLVPGGLILGGIGLVYLFVSLGVCSDGQFVTLTRRELSAYFISPIGYLVLGGMAAAEWLGYRTFVFSLAQMSERGGTPEPIVSEYIISLFPVLALTLMVPALTMRLVAEEKRSGTLEVLLTVPVNEWVIVASKFVATWAFFMICWLPAGLFLIALRVEGGAPFDYRPLLGFYVALAATGAAFVSMGLLFSVLTKNQIVAAVFTFVGMAGFLAPAIFRRADLGLGQAVQALIAKLSYINLWAETLGGQLPIRDVLLWSSLAVFLLFLSIKVLETRRWS